MSTQRDEIALRVALELVPIRKFEAFLKILTPEQKNTVAEFQLQFLLWQANIRTFAEVAGLSAEKAADVLFELCSRILAREKRDPPSAEVAQMIAPQPGDDDLAKSVEANPGVAIWDQMERIGRAKGYSENDIAFQKFVYIQMQADIFRNLNRVFPAALRAASRERGVSKQPGRGGNSSRQK